MHYKISADTALLTLLTSAPQRAIIHLDTADKLALTLLAMQKPYSKHLRRFIYKYEELVNTFLAFGVTGHDHDIQLLVIADDVRQLRKEYANIHIGDKKIVIWSHTPEEFQEGLARKEAYFLDKTRAVLVLHDPSHLLTKAKAHHE
jgi:hypothetical protein